MKKRSQIEMVASAANFISEFNLFQRDVHRNAVAKGFWEGGDRNTSEAIMLMVTELAEAVEFLRKGNGPDDKIQKFLGVEAELADCIIRIMDLAEARDWRIAEAIVAKMRYNAKRPKLHGKKF